MNAVTIAVLIWMILAGGAYVLIEKHSDDEGI